MGKCENPFFEECKGCGRETGGKCVAEKAYVRRIVEKLDENERLFLLWILAKAKGAGQWSEEKFAKALADAMPD